ncbi:MAG: M67 family metallopeptidase [Bryobacteraceae bacterium]|nr:M67 family metallopeptidase [Bryobacteraceae bacterium]
MIRIEATAWQVMLSHARSAYPKECCGILLGVELEGGERLVTSAFASRNAYEGDQSDRFLIDPRDQVKANLKSRAEGIDILGFFHSHPDCDAYFSATDLKNSWPWYSNVVLSIRGGELADAKAFRANEDQSQSEYEKLVYEPAVSDSEEDHLLDDKVGISAEFEAAG